MVIMKPITKAQRAYYLRHRGVRCPFCRSDNIGSISELEVLPDEDRVAQEITCNNCKRRWRDYYKLFEVEAEDKQGCLL